MNERRVVVEKKINKGSKKRMILLYSMITQGPLTCKRETAREKMANQRAMMSMMRGADTLRSAGEPGFMNVSRDPTWGRVGPMAPGYANRGHKRIMGGPAAGAIANLKRQMTGAPSDDPENRMVQTMSENYWVTVPRKIAVNPELVSQGARMDHFIVFIHAAMDEYDVEKDYYAKGTKGYRGMFLAESVGAGVRSVPRDRMVAGARVGGLTAYLSFEISLSEMNFILQEQEPINTNPELTDAGFLDVMDEWAFGGVQVTAKGNKTKYGMPYYTGDDSHTTSVVLGMGFTANYWGRGARRGQKLYLIAKRVSRDDGKYIPTERHSKGSPYRLGVRSGEASAERYGYTSEQAAEQGIVERPFQIIPWPRHDTPANSGDYPPPEELKYVDNDGATRRAHVMFVGTAYEPRSKMIREELYLRSHCDDVAVQMLPRVMVMVGF